MKLKGAVVALMIGCLSLVSCKQRYGQPYSNYGYADYQYGNYQMYSDPEYSMYTDYQERNNYYQRNQNSGMAQPVEVPESYHVGSYRSPVSHRNRDNNWVNQQNPRKYTIQLSEGRKPSSVARVLTRAPKRNRTATVKSFNNGQAYFRGVYGSYSSYEDAKRALDTLPEEVKNQATIKSWGSVQN